MFSVSVHRAGFDPARDTASHGMLRPEWSQGRPSEQWMLEDRQRWQTDYVTQKGHMFEHAPSEPRPTEPAVKRCGVVSTRADD